MRKIKSQNLEQLLLQLKFTPEKKRLKELEAAEKLFTIIDRDKEYPFEFVCFRITGFHTTGPGADELIKGDVLLDDLQIFISRLSNWLARPVAEQDQKIYTIEELAKTLGVSKKPYTGGGIEVCWRKCLFLTTAENVSAFCSQRSINS